MDDLDTRLRALARESLDRSAADTSVDDDLAAVRFRAVARPERQSDLARARPWPRLAVAAGMVLLVGTAVVFLANRSAEEDLVAPPDTFTPVIEPGPTDLTTIPPMTTVPGTIGTSVSTVPVEFPASLASAEPALAAPGSTVTITPAGVVRRTCLDIVSVAETGAGGLRHVGLITPSGWDASTPPTFPACLGEESGDPVEVRLPVDLEPGTYRLCVTDTGTPGGCAAIEVTPDQALETTTPTTSPPTTTPGSGVLPVGYFQRVYIEEPPYFDIGAVGPGGLPDRELTDGEVEVLLRREVAVGDGGTIRLLAPEEPYGRCDNRQVVTSGPTTAATPDANLIGPVRSLAATEGGVVIVGVDACAEGAQWGDDGTRFELRRIDLSEGSVTVLLQREPGDGDTFFADQNVVYAGGEFVVESVSPDGAYVAVAEPYTTENTRYHVFDAVTGGAPIDFASVCEDPRDLVGPPQFVGDGLVVLARECSPVAVETGDLIVELVSLETGEPVWSVDVDHVAIDSYSSTVSLSAQLIDGQVWAVVSGSAGVEQPIRAAAVTVGVEQPLPGASIVAFTPQELIEPWDPYPA